MKQLVPKKIWFLWLQGKEQMPDLVSKCYASWKHYNADWEINFLDEKNIEQYIDLGDILKDNHSRIEGASMSDIIRINLLAKHGGVWVDATCFCCKPLNEWLDKYCVNGFFALENTGIDRMIASFFLVGNSENIIVNKYCEATNNFWRDNKKLYPWIDRKWIHGFLVRSRLYKWIKRNPTIWHSFLFVKVLKIYHYFWFHYLFEVLYKKNHAFRESWNITPKLSVDIPHKIWEFGYFNPLTEQLKKDIDTKVAPFYKLTWKYDKDKLVHGTALDYLLRQI